MAAKVTISLTRQIHCLCGDPHSMPPSEAVTPSGDWQSFVAFCDFATELCELSINYEKVFWTGQPVIVTSVPDHPDGAGAYVITGDEPLGQLDDLLDVLRVDLPVAVALFRPVGGDDALALERTIIALVRDRWGNEAAFYVWATIPVRGGGWRVEQGEGAVGLLDGAFTTLVRDGVDLSAAIRAGEVASPSHRWGGLRRRVRAAWARSQDRARGLRQLDPPTPPA